MYSWARGKGSKEKDLRKADLVARGALRKRKKVGMNLGIQLILGQEGGDCDGMREEACQRAEMSQRLFRPEELGTRVRSDLSLNGKSQYRPTPILPFSPSISVCI